MSKQVVPRAFAVSGDRAMRLVNLALAAAQPAAAYVTKLAGRGVPEEERAKLVDGPVSPAPGTFIVWLPLFATSLVHGVHLARTDRLAPPLNRVMWLTSAAYACNSAWSLQAQVRGLGWPSVAIITCAATSAVSALILAERVVPPSREARLAASAVAPLAGWLTLATAANLEATLNETRGRPDERSESARALALLGAAGVAGGAVALASRGNPLYMAAIAWGLGGVVVRNARERRKKMAVVAAIGSAAFLAATALGWRRSPRRPS